MTSQITMTQERLKMDGGRRKELKKAAKRGMVQAKPNGFDAKIAKEQELANLREFLAEAKTPEEAMDIYEGLGKDILPEEEFKKFLKKFEQDGGNEQKPVERPAKEEPVAQAEQESGFDEELKASLDELAQTPSEQPPQSEQKEEPAPQVKVKIGQEEFPIEDYESEKPPFETVILRRVIFSNIKTMLDQDLPTLDQLSSSKNLKEIIELVVLEGKASPWLENKLLAIYKAGGGEWAVEQLRTEVWQKIHELQKIDSGLDPNHELGQALEAGNLTKSDYDEIVGRLNSKLGLLKKLNDRKKAVEEAPDLFALMQKSEHEQARIKASERTERRKQKTPGQFVDEVERQARAKMHRMARMRQEGATEEEIGAYEAATEDFEPTPEMIALSAEVTQIQKVAVSQLRQAQLREQLDETTLAELKNLNYTLRHLESLRVSLRHMAALARTNFEDKKEEARKFLGKTGNAESFYGTIHIEGRPGPEKGFGQKLRDARKNPVTHERVIKNKQSSALKKMQEEIGRAFAEGAMPEEVFFAKMDLINSLKKSVAPSANLDAAFAEGRLDNILTDDEFYQLRKSLT